MERSAIPDSLGATDLRLLLPPPGDGRLVLEIPAVAGRCHVLLRGERIASLEPSWTTQRVPLDDAAEGDELALRVDAAPGHRFRGFLPDVDAAPRGLWQGAYLRRTGAACFLGRPRLEWDQDEPRLETEWDGPDDAAVEVDCDELALWSPAQPRVGRMHVRLMVGGALSDEEVLPVGARRLEAEGERMLLNGEPFRVRGLLHWGLYAGLPGPDPDPEALRRELRETRARGFNLIKCCLWVPPTRFLDVCDEEGMPVWLEYPLWNEALTSDAVDAYRAFLAHDAAHPCVVMRTLTCENDRREEAASRAVAGLVRRHDPNALLADNSAWLGHTHVADFHDEHPYLNAAQWPAYLRRLRAALGERGPKPLVLGETIVADTLADSSPLAVDAAQAADSRHLGLRARRYQIESFAAAFPHAGWVVCGASDAPKAPLGLRDAVGGWKDEVADWAWQAALAPAAEVEVDSPPLPPAPPLLPEGAWRADALDDATLDRLEQGATVLHCAGARPGTWRAAEALFWSWVPELRGPAADGELRRVLLDHLPVALLSGRRLVPHPEALDLVALAEVHDIGPELPRPRSCALLQAGRVGRGVLVLSALRDDTPAGGFVHDAVLAALAADPSALPHIELPPATPSRLLRGPWELDGRRFRTGTLLANEGMNATWGARVVRGRLAAGPLPEGPLFLHAEAVGDGWELFVDGELLHRHGNPGQTWDAGRDLPACVAWPEALRTRAEQDGVELEWRVHDHRGAGVLVGPVWLQAGMVPLLRFGPPPSA
jgi:hypothetical protein